MIKDYREDGIYGELYNSLGKNNDRLSIVEALKLVQEELEKVNV